MTSAAGVERTNRKRRPPLGHIRLECCRAREDGGGNTRGSSDAHRRAPHGRFCPFEDTGEGGGGGDFAGVGAKDRESISPCEAEERR